MPTAARVYTKERERRLKEEMPKMTGWKCETLTYETSMHKITTQKGIILISTHVDDCDAARRRLRLLGAPGKPNRTQF